jgi:hypothetical protein
VLSAAGFQPALTVVGHEPSTVVGYLPENSVLAFQQASSAVGYSAKMVVMSQQASTAVGHQPAKGLEGSSSFQSQGM